MFDVEITIFIQEKTKYLRVIRRWNSIKESSNLCSQITDHDKLFQHIFGQNVGVASFFDVVWTDINVISSQMQVGSRNCTHSPFSFGSKRIRLVVTRRAANCKRNLISFICIFCHLQIYPYLFMFQIQILLIRKV